MDYYIIILCVITHQVAALPNTIDPLQSTKLVKPYIKLDGQQCSLLSQVQGSIIELYSNDNKCNSNLHKLHRTVASIESKMKGFDQSMGRMKQNVRNYQAAEGKPESRIGGARAAAKDHMTTMDAHHMMRRNNRNRKLITQMIKSTERKTTNLVRDIDRRSSYNIKLLERKIQNLKKHLENRVDAGKMERMTIHKLRIENRNREEKIQRQQGELNGVKERIEWMERAMEKMMHNGFMYQHDDPSTTVEVPAPPNTCPVGFIRNAMSCYKFENASLNWEEAERYCSTYGPDSHLVSVETKEENSYIIGVRKYNEAKWSSPFVWTGGHDTEREGQWRWVGTSKYVNYNYWMENEPNGGKEQNCLYYTGDKNYRWDDWNCVTTKMNFICEINLQLKSVFEKPPPKDKHKKKTLKKHKKKNDALETFVERYMTNNIVTTETPKATKTTDELID